MNCLDFLEFIKSEFGNLGSEEGLRYKYYEDEINGIVVCWMVSKKVLDFTVKNKFNLLIAHEDLYFPPEYAGGDKSGVVSDFRKEILEKNRINFLRLHYTIDKNFIFDVFDQLSGGKILIKENLYRVYEFENKKLENVAKELKKRYKVEFLRITEPNKKVKRVGCLVGGLGLSINSKFIDKILSYNVDTVIAGEVDEYTIRALSDLKIGIIELGHEVSETPGLIKFTQYLKKKLPEITVKYLKNGYPVKILK
ncbi:MAG: Nif3-like dinuclear metal center hexameric protein [Candidatus Omnitrophica bacterium]|nr:Nif3-like dinuclear metal center hexameric protein [Candidatus Omnitrophota bacterium]MCM8803089.1 Nif3-like dinuclear metal center hexameric protein [Candidatus Omnitrophota bacterium]